MTIDFLYQNLIWLVVGLLAARGWKFIETRVRRRRFRRFFGAGALDVTGVVISVPVLGPLSRDNFDANAEKTLALKTDDTGREVRLPIYEEVLNFRDYQSANEVIRLLRGQGAKEKNISLIPDSESLGIYQEKAPCLVCLGSPFVNAALGEVLRLAEDRHEQIITGNRTSNTLDSYRIGLCGPEKLSLGVDEKHAIGVIARLPNPVKPKDYIVGVWGCRAESTLKTSSYFRANFKKLAKLADEAVPLIIILSVHGPRFSVVEEMYVTTDHVIARDDKLLSRYLRTATPDPSADSSAKPGA